MPGADGPEVMPKVIPEAIPKAFPKAFPKAAGEHIRDGRQRTQRTSRCNRADHPEAILRRAAEPPANTSSTPTERASYTGRRSQVDGTEDAPEAAGEHVLDDRKAHAVNKF
jgi:hypothetical protein